MKPNSTIFRTGLGLSALAILPFIYGTGWLSQPAAAQQSSGSPAVAPAVVPASNPGADPDDILFWAVAWGMPYAPHQYMLMEPSSSDSDLLSVKLVADHGLDYTNPNLTEQDVLARIVAHGSFDASSWGFSRDSYHFRPAGSITPQRIPLFPSPK